MWTTLRVSHANQWAYGRNSYIILKLSFVCVIQYRDKPFSENIFNHIFLYCWQYTLGSNQPELILGSLHFKIYGIFLIILLNKKHFKSYLLMPIKRITSYFLKHVWVNWVNPTYTQWNKLIDVPGSLLYPVGRQVISRTCIEDAKDARLTSGCVTEDAAGGTVQRCYCQGDLCNASAVSTLSNILSLATVLLAVRNLYWFMFKICIMIMFLMHFLHKNDQNIFWQFVL